MSKKINPFNDALCFSVSNNLEKYRVESILEKEPETIAWINNFDDISKPTFFDIGANISVYSLYAGYRHPAFEIFPFEPVSNNFTALKNNILINKQTRIYPLQLALSNNKKITNIYLQDKRVGNSGAQIGRAVDHKGENYVALRVEKVLSIPVDILISEYGLPLPRYIKIDVDGHETDILMGMMRTLAQPALKSLLVEFNNDKEFNLYQKRLLALGFYIDKRFDDLPNHSRHRRASSGTTARNYIFTRAN